MLLCGNKRSGVWGKAPNIKPKHKFIFDKVYLFRYILKILEFVIFLVNFFPPQKVAKSARIELVLNHTKIVLHVR